MRNGNAGFSLCASLCSYFYLTGVWYYIQPSLEHWQHWSATIREKRRSKGTASLSSNSPTKARKWNYAFFLEMIGAYTVHLLTTILSVIWTTHSGILAHDLARLTRAKQAGREWNGGEDRSRAGKLTKAIKIQNGCVGNDMHSTLFLLQWCEWSVRLWPPR